jgi:hypothetical protein
MNRREFNKALPVLAAAAVIIPAEILQHGSPIRELSPMEAAMQSIDLNNQARKRTIYWNATIGENSFEGRMMVDEETYDQLINHSEELSGPDVGNILEDAIDQSQPIQTNPGQNELSFGIGTDQSFLMR